MFNACGWGLDRNRRLVHQRSPAQENRAALHQGAGAAVPEPGIDRFPGHDLSTSTNGRKPMISMEWTARARPA